MKIRTFDALVGRKMTLGDLEGEVAHRFVLESLFGMNAVMTPADKRAMEYARAVEPKTMMRIVASVDDGMLTGELLVDRWSDRSGGLRVNKPRELRFAQRRRTVRLPVKLPVDLTVVRDGECTVVHGQTEDISIGGFSCILDSTITAGEAVVAMLHLPDEPVVVTARITLVESLRRRLVHARMLSISPEDYKILAKALPLLEEELEKAGKRV